MATKRKTAVGRSSIPRDCRKGVLRDRTSIVRWFTNHKRLLPHGLVCLGDVVASGAGLSGCSIFFEVFPVEPAWKNWLFLQFHETFVTTSGCPRVAIRWCGDFQVRGVCHPFVMCTRLNVPIRIRGMLCNPLRVPFPPGFQNTGLRRFSNGLQLVPTPTAGTFRHPCEQTGSWPAVLQGSFRIVCLLGGLVDCISVCPRGM
jgi:hypothetical protein